MKPIMFFLVATLALILGGCCCASVPSGAESDSSYSSNSYAPASSGCQYGTYEEACTAQCARLGVSGTGCASSCVNDVEAAGMGSGSTCCKETFRSACRNMCESGNGEGFDSISDCAADCVLQYDDAGYDVDACATAS
jgi:hypothetical protein